MQIDFTGDMDDIVGSIDLGYIDDLSDILPIVERLEYICKRMRFYAEGQPESTKMELMDDVDMEVLEESLQNFTEDAKSSEIDL